MKRFKEIMGLLAAVFICTSCVFLCHQPSAYAQVCGDCPNDPKPCTSAAICEGKAVGVPFKYAGFDVWCHDLNRVCPIGIDCCGVSFGKKGTVSFDPPRTIPDGDPGGIIEVVEIIEPGALVDLDVILEVNHSRVGDLVVELRHDGVTVRLIDRPGHPSIPMGCDANLVCGTPVYLTDGAEVPIECSPDECAICFPGGVVSNYIYASHEPLDAFVGQNMSGIWEIFVSDNASGEAGEVCGVSLLLATEQPVRTEQCSWGMVKEIYK